MSLSEILSFLFDYKKPELIPVPANNNNNQSNNTKPKNN